MCALYLALKPLVLALQKGLFYTPIATAKKQRPQLPQKVILPVLSKYCKYKYIIVHQKASWADLTQSGKIPENQPEQGIHGYGGKDLRNGRF